ncbi:hypothetical protein D3C80_1110070 [compost metagenome]
MLLQGGARILVAGPEILAVEQHTAGQRRLQADQVAQQGALAAAAAAHDDEHLAAADGEIEVVLDHLAAVAGAEAFHRENRLAHAQIPSWVQIRVISASLTTRATMMLTTARVVAWPTAWALRPQLRP